MVQYKEWLVIVSLKIEELIVILILTRNFSFSEKCAVGKSFSGRSGILICCLEDTGYANEK